MTETRSIELRIGKLDIDEMPLPRLLVSLPRSIAVGVPVSISPGRGSLDARCSDIVGIVGEHRADRAPLAWIEKRIGDPGDNLVARVTPGERRPGTKGKGTGDECEGDHEAAQGRNPCGPAHWDGPIALRLVGEISQTELTFRVSFVQ